METKLESPKSSKIEKPLIQLPEVKPFGIFLRSTTNKNLEKIEKMIKDIEKSQGKRTEPTEVVEDTAFSFRESRIHLNEQIVRFHSGIWNKAQYNYSTIICICIDMTSQNQI